ncbi:TetR/AcrR family transcriptional regulator [Nocardioides sp.]|uniref:TetR/AcrR family transcriptional regulator n=1 Tax=Nocardioides sp. TaxID=35761 RepID=UPI002ED98CF6
MTKGTETRAAILDEAAAIASQVGLGGLTIGTLATRTGLSKSGLFAHFASKEALQVDVLVRARDQFVDRVLRPAIATPRGEPRVRALFEHWLAWQQSGLPGGCIFIDAVSEFDDQDGPVRDELLRSERDKAESVMTIAATAVAEGHFAEGLDLEQFVFELEGIMLTHHHSSRMLRDPRATTRAHTAFDRLVESARPSH